MGTTLVIASHMDDETISSGGLISRRVEEGHEVCIMTLLPRTYDYGKTQVFSEEMKDLREAAMVLGVPGDKVWCVAVGPEGEPAKIGYYPVLKKIERMLEKLVPNEVIIPSDRDLNQDHIHLSHVCKIALRPANLGAVHRVLMALGCDGTTQEANYIVPLHGHHLDRKLEALACYKRESRVGAHPRAPENITAMARHYGVKAGHSFGEPYKLVLEREVL